MDGIDILSHVKRDKPRGARRHHLGPWQHRDRRRGHQAGRLRLHREAVQHRPASGGDPSRDGGLAPQARKNASLRRQDVRQAEMIGGGAAFPDDEIATRQGDPVERPRHADGRPRLGQGGGGTLHPQPVEPGGSAHLSSSPPPRSSPRRWRCSCSAAKAPERGGRTGPSGAGPWRGDLLRRGGGHAAGHAIQDPARPRRSELYPRGRHREGPGRSARHILDLPAI